MATEFNLAGVQYLPRVDVVVSYVGADGCMIDAAVQAGARGIVSAGTGAGRPTPIEQAALDRAVTAGVAVCIASRVGSGRVVRSPRYAAKGYVTADNLQPWKARTLLAFGAQLDGRARRTPANIRYLLINRVRVPLSAVREKTASRLAGSNDGVSSRGELQLNVSERVYRDIKEAILSGRLGPESRLVEIALAAEFGVSRTPVREALKRLEAESLIVNHPVRGMVVKPIGRREVEDFYHIREALDGLAARLAAERISADEVVRLEALVEAMEDATASGRPDSLVQMNLLFHQTILEAAGNAWLMDIGSSLRDFVRRLSTDAFRYRERDLSLIVEEHRAIVEALRRGDPDGAATAAAAHMYNARRHFVRRTAVADVAELTT